MFKQDLMLGKMQNRSCPGRCYPRCWGVTLRRGVTQCEDLPKETNYQIWGFTQGEELPNVRIYPRRGISKCDIHPRRGITQCKDLPKERKYPVWEFTQGEELPVWVTQGAYNCSSKCEATTITISKWCRMTNWMITGAGWPDEWS